MRRSEYAGLNGSVAAQSFGEGTFGGATSRDPNLDNQQNVSSTRDAIDNPAAVGVFAKGAARLKS